MYLESLNKAILDELNEHDWSQPLQATVQELGLAMGNHIGLKRNRNEDRIAVARISAPNKEIYTIAIVCDGVGGSIAGDQAATIAIATVLSELCAQRSKEPISEIITHLVKFADDQIRSKLEGKGSTTLSMFLATSVGTSICVNIGDSRVYSWTPQGQIHQITTDDTVENELKALPGDHEALIKARGLKGRLSQAMGETGRSSHDLRVRVIPFDFSHNGVLLGSDGLWKVVKDFDAVMSNAQTSIDAVRRGINLANWVGGLDNSSIIAIEDIKKFCKPKFNLETTQQRASISLWIGNSKYRFLSDSRPDWLETAKPVNSGRRPSKSKKNDFKDPRIQLELQETKMSSKGQKPAIEVTFNTSYVNEDNK